MTNKKKMTIIGFGRMGRKFAEISLEGFNVHIVSTRNVRSDVEKLGARLVQDLRLDTG